MKKQVHVFYTGNVQGVGFRFTTEEIARELGVRGWVKNLRNGQVEVVAEAEEDVVKEFLNRIVKEFSRYIRDMDADWQPETAEIESFEIKF